MRTWTERQAADFLHAVAEGRLTGHGSSLYGLHGGEVRGLCCSDIDLSARTITIQEACVKVTGSGVAEVDPTTGQASEPCRWMTLSPLGPALPQARQAREHLETGEALFTGRCSSWTLWASAIQSLSERFLELTTGRSPPKWTE